MQLLWETKPVEPSPELVEYRETSAPSTVGTAAYKIDFTNIRSLAFTQPTEYSYFGGTGQGQLLDAVICFKSSRLPDG